MVGPTDEQGLPNTKTMKEETKIERYFGGYHGLLWDSIVGILVILCWHNSTGDLWQSVFIGFLAFSIYVINRRIEKLFEIIDKTP